MNMNNTFDAPPPDVPGQKQYGGYKPKQDTYNNPQYKRRINNPVMQHKPMNYGNRGGPRNYHPGNRGPNPNYYPKHPDNDGDNYHFSEPMMDNQQMQHRTYGFQGNRQMGYRNNFNDRGGFKDRRDHQQNNFYRPQNQGNIQQYPMNGPHHGKWDENEKEALEAAIRDAVAELSLNPDEVCAVGNPLGFDFDGRIEWEKIAERVQTRNATQCKNKYIDWVIQPAWNNEDESNLREAWRVYSREIIQNVDDPVFANEDQVPEESVDLNRLRDLVNVKRSPGGVRAKLSVMCSKSVKERGWRPATYKSTYPTCVNCVLRAIQNETSALIGRVNMMSRKRIGEMGQENVPNLPEEIEKYTENINFLMKKFEDAKKRALTEEPIPTDDNSFVADIEEDDRNINMDQQDMGYADQQTVENNNFFN